MVLGDDPEAKANAALVLGELGDDSAIPMLRFAAGRSAMRAGGSRAKIVELQLAEAMAKLGDHQALLTVRAALFTPPEQAELTALACQMCGRLGDRGAVADLSNMLAVTGATQPPGEVRLAAVTALALLDRTRVDAKVPLEYAESDVFQLRAQAALTMGVLRDGSTMPKLLQLLADRNPMVQVAAAGAILRMTAGR
jgi:HEAT repeat protein